MNNNFVENLLNAITSSNNQLTDTQRNYIDTIRSGDASKGEELARNLCRSMGVTPQQATQQAEQFFRNRFFNRF